jgi:hypothetical protein
MLMNATNTTSPLAPVAHLSTESLNERARKAAAIITRSGMCLRDNEATAYQAARLGCAHLGFVETLEAAAKRAERLLSAQGKTTST